MATMDPDLYSLSDELSTTSSVLNHHERTPLLQNGTTDMDSETHTLTRTHLSSEPSLTPPEYDDIQSHPISQNKKSYAHQDARDATMHDLQIHALIGIKSWNHLICKFIDYFAFFLAPFLGVSFMQMAWIVGSINFGSLASTLFLPLLSSSYPCHKIHFYCQIILSLSTLLMAWWVKQSSAQSVLSGFLFSRIVFGFCFSILLHNFSLCVASFIPKSKQSKTVKKIELSWCMASFSFIIFAYILDHASVSIIFYIFGIPSIFFAMTLYLIMPAIPLIHESYDGNNLSHLFYEIFNAIVSSHFSMICFLIGLGLSTIAYSMVIICLAPWFAGIYDLSITEYGYTTLVIGTSQLASLILSYRFRKLLGSEWSTIAGIAVQLVTCLILYGFAKKSYAFNSDTNATEMEGHESIPLLFVLLVLCVHFIGAEFAYAQGVAGCLQLVPNVSSTVIGNLMRIVTSVSRIVGVVIGVWIWLHGGLSLLITCLCVILAVSFLILLFLVCFKPVTTSIHSNGFGKRVPESETHSNMSIPDAASSSGYSDDARLLAVE